MKTNHVITSLVIAFVASSIGFGQAYLPFYPSDLGTKSASQMSSGATGIVANPSYSSLWENPAMLGFGSEGITSSLSFGLQRREEFRSVQMIDLFDDVVTKNAYASNRDFYPSYHGGLTGSLPFMDNKLKFGIGISPYWDFQYDYNEEVRGNLPSGEYNRDPLVGYHVLQRSGALYTVGGGFSFNIIPNINIGLSLSSFVASNLVGKTEIVVVDTNRIDDALAGYPMELGGDITLEESSLLINAGFTMNVGQHSRIGFSYRSPVGLILKDNAWYPTINERTQLPGLILISDTTFTHDLEIPAQLGFGYQHKLDHTIYPVTVNMEVRYTDWSKYSFSYDPLMDSTTTFNHHFQETWDFRTSVEYLVRNSFPVRIGFIYKESPLGQEFESSTITLGTAYSMGRFVIDFGGWFNRIEYLYEDIFPAISETIDPLETVTEWNSQLVVTLNYTF
ncbi:MAG: outer membrane protein transport protein [Candidatus Marinimicrobia bacterium]|nr:outer membrane protein transport protein [Candidatus Neomarinimicrobiota bacterium]